ncbi:MAG: hypothetical protein K8I00_09850, partial [Candidatus Omnitrophica bacterium]|nr:hypothetical protein [Candidatus Omnitrophota bacterium]
MGHITRHILRIYLTAVCGMIGMVSPVITGPAVAQDPTPELEMALPEPGAMVSVGPAFRAPVIQGITFYPGNPLQFDFLVSPGDENPDSEELQQESLKLIKYFLTALTVPEDELWVNLSPYEKDRIVPADLGRTRMGRDLLAQDYLLKQVTASLMYPEETLGREFWQRVYRRASAEFGTTDLPMNTFNKVWIITETATVYTHGQTVYVVNSRLKVMLEEDYLALQHHQAQR